MRDAVHLQVTIRLAQSGGSGGRPGAVVVLLSVSDAEAARWWMLQGVSSSASWQSCWGASPACIDAGALPACHAEAACGTWPWCLLIWLHSVLERLCIIARPAESTGAVNTTAHTSELGSFHYHTSCPDHQLTLVSGACEATTEVGLASMCMPIIASALNHYDVSCTLRHTT